MERWRSRARCWAAAQLQIDLPLQILIEHHAAPVFPAERARFRGELRVLICPAAIAARSTVRDSGGADIRRARSRWRIFPAGRPRDRGTPGTARARAEPLAPFAQKLDEQQLQEAQLERADPFVLHERRSAQGLDLGGHLRPTGAQLLCAPAVREILHAFHVEIQEILVEGAVRQVRAGVERPAVVDGVQRIQRHEAGTPVVRRRSPPPASRSAKSPHPQLRSERTP